MKKRKNLSHAEMLTEFVKSDEFFIEYLNTILTDEISVEQQMVAICDVIEALLIAKKLNKSELAKNMHITRNTLYKIAEHKNPTLIVFLKLIKTLGINLQFTLESKKKKAA